MTKCSRLIYLMISTCVQVSLSVGDRVMLMAGQFGVAFMENNNWHLSLNVFQEDLK